MILLIAMLVMSLISFLMMGWDKRCAKRGSWRVSEKALFLSAILMGAIGGTIGMNVFRHKTKHWYFKLFFPLLAAIQILLVIWLLSHSATPVNLHW